MEQPPYSMLLLCQELNHEKYRTWNNMPNTKVSQANSKEFIFIIILTMKDNIAIRTRNSEEMESWEAMGHRVDIWMMLFFKLSITVIGYYLSN